LVALERSGLGFKGGVPRIRDVILHAAIFAAEEMGVVLRRTALSPNIRDRLDFSCAVLSPEGDLVAQAEHIPVHLGSMAVGLRNLMSELERLGITLEEGDVVAVNDPYIAGTHLNDIMLVKPVYASGRLVAYVANKAHHVDVGGQVPGSIGGSVVELIQEGVTIPPVKIVERGSLRKDIIRILKANVRTPGYFEGDIKAQLASLNVGERMIRGLAEKYGVSELLETWRWALDYTEEYTRNAVRDLGVTGTSSAEDYLELDGGLAKIRARVEIKGSGDVLVDFDGSSRQVEAPVNAVYGVTVAATLFALKSVIDPEMPMNSGFERVIRIRAPPGSIVNPVRPAPVSAGNVETSQRIADVVFKALADLVPERVPAASCGSMNNVAVGGRGWAFYETIGCGSGGRPCCDGVDGVHTNMTNTMNTPIEILERSYPVLFVEYKLREGSGGPGRYRGGLGIVRAFIALEDGVRVTITGERVKLRPWGLKGGMPGAPAEYLVVRSDGRVERLPSKATVSLRSGDMVVIKTAGGGGWGDPSLRPRSLVERDLREGRITLEEAEKYYKYRAGGPSS
jgi:N-methylhydantoinase B